MQLKLLRFILLTSLFAALLSRYYWMDGYDSVIIIAFKSRLGHKERTKYTINPIFSEFNEPFYLRYLLTIS